MIGLEHLAGLYDRFGAGTDIPVRSFTLRGVRFAPHPAISLMGVVNLSPDSAHRESVALSTEAAVRRGRRLVADGAAIVDIGAESSVGGRERVDVERQRKRLLPVVRQLAEEGIVVSVETYDLTLARECLEAGAAILNLTTTVDTAPFHELVARHEAGLVVCYMQGTRSVDTRNLEIGEDHTATVLEFLAREVRAAEDAGVTRMWVDPGLGFSYGNLTDVPARTRYLVDSLVTGHRLRELGWPLLQQPPSAFDNFEDEVRCGEAFYSVFAVLGRVDVIRTHEVARVRGVVRTMSDYPSTAPSPTRRVRPDE